MPFGATTLYDLVEETLRRIQPAQMDISVTLGQDVPIGSVGDTVVLRLTGGRNQLNFVAGGMVLSIDLENFYVSSYSQTTSEAQVIRGYQGSTPAAHLGPVGNNLGATVYCNPKFTRFDVATAINEELADLSANGLFQVRTIDVTYNPVFAGYDLPIDEGFIEVIGVRYKEAPPVYRFPEIKHWDVLPYMSDSHFPSGQGLIIYEAGWPGLPMHVWYSAAFAPLFNLNDDVIAGSGLPPTAVDILPVGAGIILNQDREIKRNFTEAQPDARKATEVPPGAVMNATKQMQLWRDRRVAAERARLKNKYKGIRHKP
jgi:hypothetical protein